jgi:T5SS/PEP-CTERM-associated repeat protein
MKKTSLSRRSPLPSAVAAALLLGALAANAQQVFNGSHNLFGEALTPPGILVGVGQGQNADLNLSFSTIVTPGSTAENIIPDSRIADSEGTGTRNQVLVNIGEASSLAFGGSQSTTSHLGVDGDLTINLNASGAFLGTRQSILAELPGSSATINLIGNDSFATQPQWSHYIWFVDVGRAGTAEVNVLNGGRITSAQRFVIGGTVLAATSEVPAGGTGSLTVDGPGSVINFANSSSDAAGLHVGRRGSGTAVISNGGAINAVSSATSGTINPQRVWVGNQPGGQGTLSIQTGGALNTHLFRIGNAGGEGTVHVTTAGTVDVREDFWVGVGAGSTGSLLVDNGGVVNAAGVFRISSESADSSVATVDGAGSRLTSGIQSFIGNTGREGTVGTLNITNGGAVSIGTYLRVGNQAGATGVVNIEGSESSLEVATNAQFGTNGNGTLNVSGGGVFTVHDYFHVGSNGVGTMTIASGGKARANLPGNTGHTYIGRHPGSDGLVEVAGAGSQFDVGNNLMIAANLDGSRSEGTATLIVRDNAVVNVGNNFRIRTGGAVELDGGAIFVGAGNTNLYGSASLKGHGTLTGNVEFGGESVLQGTTGGITLTGTLTGTGAVENFTLNELRAVASTGSLTLNDVRFSSGGSIQIRLDQIEAQNLISFDGQTSFSGASLNVSFEGVWLDETDTIRLFTYTGSGSPAYDFASVSLPWGWVLTNGLLHHENYVPGGSVFGDWAGSYGLSGEAAAPGSDPDGDGFTNLQEFAFGTHPAQATASLFHVSRNGSQLVLRWNRSLDAGVSYQIETSTGLVNWAPVAGAQPTVMATPDQTPPAGYERVEWSAPLDGNRAFYRVSAQVSSGLLP